MNKFRHSLRYMLAGAGLMLSLAAFAAAQPTPTPIPDETPAQHDARMAWWRTARFGMFIHWGIYAVPAGGEWYMTQHHVPRDKYAEYAQEFDPTNFNADTWAKIARKAGMKYMVITSKHHDGFCMFPTTATTYNVVDATPWHHDPLQDLSAACDRQGVKFCVYHSIMDWHSPDQAPADADPEHPTYNPTSFVPGKKDDYIQYLKTELKELDTHYHPGVLWFDGEWMKGWTEADGSDLYAYLRNLDPALIINNRLGSRSEGVGDFGTPEQHIPPTGLPGQDWETCMTINSHWGYAANDHNFKSTATLLRNLIDIASKGGNYLLNVGPDATGVIPQPEVERLLAMGQWLKVNGVAIYDTTASPFGAKVAGSATANDDGKGKESWVWRCTKRVTPEGVTLYLHIFEWPKDGKFLVPGLKNQVAEAYLLKSNFFGIHKHLKTVNGDDGVTISVPATAPDKIASVIALKIQGPLEINQ